jgi:predicted acylesterase/phospholipase RssA
MRRVTPSVASVCEVQPRPSLEPERSRFRILAIDGGGIRGLIAAKVLARLEELLRARDGSPTLLDCFDLLAGTSTGGLISLALAAPGEDGGPPLTAARLVEIYRGEEGRAIFERPLVRRIPVLGSAIDLFLPKYSLGPLRKELEREVGAARMADARKDVLISAYDMHGREPRFFKRWTDDATQVSMVDAGLATAAAPTYFPSHRVGGGALVDGGVFAANPTVAAVVEALKRTEDPERLTPDDLLVVSLGTGDHELGYEPEAVERWGALDWALPQGGQRFGGEPPLIAAILDGQSDAAHHWAHVLLNHEPGTAVSRAAEMGAGPRYYRYEVGLRERLPMDDAGRRNIDLLEQCADALIRAREDELAALAEALTGPRGGTPP